MSALRRTNLTREREEARTYSDRSARTEKPKEKHNSPWSGVKYSRIRKKSRRRAMKDERLRRFCRGFLKRVDSNRTTAAETQSS